MPYMEILKPLREGAGLSQKALGELVGVSEVSISNYEGGKREPSFDTLCFLADYFDVSLDMLVRGKEKERPVKEPTLQEMLEIYGHMTDAELELHAALINASLAERRYRAAQEGNK